MQLSHIEKNHAHYSPNTIHCGGRGGRWLYAYVYQNYPIVRLADFNIGREDGVGSAGEVDITLIDKGGGTR